MKRFCLLLVLFVPFLFYSQEERANDERQKLIKEVKDKEASLNLSEKDTLYRNLLVKTAKSFTFYNTDTLKIYAEKLLQYSNTVKDKTGVAYAYNLIGDYYANTGKEKRSIGLYNKAYKAASEAEEENLKIDILNHIAGAYSSLGDYSEALKSYLKGLDYAKSVGNKDYESILTENIAHLYVSQRAYGEALSLYNDILKINEEIGNDFYKAQTLCNLSFLHTDMGDYESAMECINKSIEILEKTTYVDWLGYSYIAKGNVYLSKSNFKWALYWYNRAELLYKNVDDPATEVELYAGLAKSYLGQEDFEQALIHATKAYKIAAAIESLEHQREGAGILYKVYKHNNHLEKALQYLEEYQSLSDKLFSDENQKSLNLLQTRITYNKEKEGLIRANEQALASQRSTIFWSVIIVLVLLGTLIPLYLNQQKVMRLYRKLKNRTTRLKEREEDLKDANSTKNRMFSIIGHDLRGPVGALKDVLTLLTEGEMTKNEFWEFLPKFKKDVDHVLFTLDNLLTWGYSQAKGSNHSPKPNDLGIIVENNLKFLGELAEAKKINLNSKVEEGVHVFADKDQIDLVIRNLLSNAIKFTPLNGNITVFTKSTDKEVQIAIRDNGVGMSDKIQSRIFQEGASVTTYGTNNEKGTGLGLSLCKEMVLMNKGRIWVESELQKGSTFYVTLPKAFTSYKHSA